MPFPAPLAFEVNGRTIELEMGDISQQEADAIVNAANSSLAGGSGVDGAIHSTGGPTIMQETGRRYPSGCATGSAVVSSAGRLKAKHVIHAVGPRWNGGDHGEDLTLGSAYRAAFQLAVAHGCRSIALPALGTGAYRYPMDEAAEIAVAMAVEALSKMSVDEDALRTVRFVLFSEAAFSAFQRAISARLSG